MLLPSKRKHGSIGGCFTFLPSIDCGLASGASLKPNMHRHDHAEIADADPHLPIPHFVSWRFLNKRRQTLPHKSDSLSLNTSEQFGNAPQSLSGGNRLISVSVPFLPTALFARRTAGTA